MLRLAPYIGAGTLANPYRPRGVTGVPGWSAIDLRRPGTAAGRALVWYPPGVAGDAQMDDLADDPLETITAGRLTTLLGRLGVASLTARRWDRIVGELLLNPPVNGWNPIQPAGNRYEVFLAGREWWAQPIIQGGSSDDFNRANETPLAGVWSTCYSGSGGNLNLSSNAVTSGGGICGSCFFGAASSADQYAAATQLSTPAANSWGPLLRAKTDGTFYAFRDNDIYRCVTGSFTLVATLTGSSSNGDRLLANAVGSTLRLYRNGTQVSGSPGTDTAITAADQPGLWITATGGSIDDFDGGNGTGLSLGGVSKNTRSWPLGVEIGMGWRMPT